MLEQLQQAYTEALGNVIFVDFKRKVVIKEAANVQNSKAR